MHSLLAPTLLMLAAVAGGKGTTDLPHPWLTVNRSATLLRLLCKPPPPDISSSWEDILDLRLSAAALDQYGRSVNISLVNMTSIMDEPKVNDRFVGHSRATFQGQWEHKTVSLELVIPPLRDQVAGYFCTMTYRDQDLRYGHFTAEVTVDDHDEPSRRSKDNFEVSVMYAHQVQVTWRKPERSTFTEARVSRQRVDDEGEAVNPPESLFATTGDADFVYNSDVLVCKYNKTDGENSSILLYVKTDAHDEVSSLSFRYSCSVPYPACIGHEAASCTCCQQGSNPDRQVCPTCPGDSCHELFHFIIVLVVLVLLIVVVLLFVGVVYRFFKTGRFKGTRLEKCFTPNREPSNPDENEKMIEEESRSPNPGGEDMGKHGRQSSSRKEESRSDMPRSGAGSGALAETSKASNSQAEEGPSGPPEDEQRPPTRPDWAEARSGSLAPGTTCEDEVRKLRQATTPADISLRCRPEKDTGDLRNSTISSNEQTSSASTGIDRGQMDRHTEGGQLPPIPQESQSIGTDDISSTLGTDGGSLVDRRTDDIRLSSASEPDEGKERVDVPPGIPDHVTSSNQLPTEEAHRRNSRRRRFESCPN